MNAPRIALSRASAGLLGRGLTTAAPTTRPCEALLRQFSNYQPWYASSDKIQTTPSYHPYPLNPKQPPAPRNEPISEASIVSPIPTVHETRPPAQQQTLQPRAAAQPESAITQQAVQKPKPAAPKRKLRPRKAALKLTPAAVEHLRGLLDQPEPKLIKVGVRNRGCSGLSYHLDYVDKAGPFDEEVEQDGVRVLIDSKALFSIIGSEMDWIEDKLSQRFHFSNPNIKGECGCGESFMV
ncbi:iron-binding protein iscA [Hypoxylon rubiginosum]|uniref:Iron-binding protein iscA n=1 Tax=Hypoxylon rubiginosum TaxID=110542 RepID=A0ACC0CV61_9PEZI|nr:iron-binding protein iscA [Hypoxylon rubiginosum]